MDFLPSSITSAGISWYFVSVMKVPTYFVSPVFLEKSPGANGCAAPESATIVAAIAPKDALPKSRRRIHHHLLGNLRLNFIDPHFGLFVPVMRDGEIITVQLR